MVYNWPVGSDRYNRVSRFVNALFADRPAAAANSPSKWRETALAQRFQDCSASRRLRIGWRRQTKPSARRPKAREADKTQLYNEFLNGAGELVAERLAHDVEPVRRCIELFRLPAGYDHGPAHVTRRWPLQAFGSKANDMPSRSTRSRVPNSTAWPAGSFSVEAALVRLKPFPPTQPSGARYGS